MAESRTVLPIEPRAERGSRAGRRLRRDGFVPGVVYGVDSESISFKVDSRKLRAVLAEGHALFDIQLDGNKQPVIVKDQQRDPVLGRLMHVDLLRVRLHEKIQSTVPLELEGAEEAPGVKEGGVLGHVTRELLVEALPTDIPDQIVADVSALGVAETLTLDRVALPAGVEFVVDNPEEVVVATITAPSEIEEPEEIEEEAELIGEEGELPEGEEPAEGELPAEGEAPAQGEDSKAAEGEGGGKSAKES